MALTLTDVVAIIKTLISDSEKLEKFKEIVTDLKELISDIKDIIR